MRENDYCFYSIESHPADGQLPAGRSTLTGWVVPKPGEHFVDLRLRLGAVRFPGILGFPRPDLADYFKDNPAAFLSGFSIQVDLAPGPAVLALEALSLSGRWQPCGLFTFNATAAPASAPLAPPEPFRAHEFARTLRLLLKNPADSPESASDGVIPYPRALRDNHPPFYGYLDEPSVLAPALYGRLAVLGWLFHETLSVKRAFATADLLVLQPLQVGGPFSGVAARFPQYPQAADCRIFGFADVMSQQREPAVVRVYAELADGSFHLALVTRCRPISTAEINLPWPHLAFGQFRRAKNDLLTALAARAIAVETGPLFKKALRDLQLEYRTEVLRRPEAIKPVKPARAGSQPFDLLLVTHNLNREGAPLFLLEYARHLIATRDARISLLSLAEGPLRPAFEAAGIEVLTGSIESARPRLAAGKFQLVVANTLACHWAVAAAYAAGVPSLLYIHESTSLPAFFKTQPEALRPAQKALAQASAVSFLTESSRRYYEACSRSGNFRTLPGWIDLAAIDRWQAGHARATLRTELGLRAGERLVVNIGTVCDRKGQHIFVRAVELFRRRHPQLAAACRFVMVGGRDTPYNRDIEALVAALAFENLSIVPETPDVYAYYGSADAFVCTSYEESFPRVILEAMAFSLPIVSTDVHGIPEIVRSGQEALLLPPGNPDALCHLLHQVLRDQEKAQAMARQARQRLEQNFTAEKILPRHAALACELARRPAEAKSLPLA